MAGTTAMLTTGMVSSAATNYAHAEICCSRSLFRHSGLRRNGTPPVRRRNHHVWITVFFMTTCGEHDVTP
ncbi:hypothetical protein [Flexivirga sp.]|uniref:hypothetical protein n=1 Tax=Flexivirga sp. TaxID=1962927 RepID=UPI003F821F2A